MTLKQKIDKLGPFACIMFEVVKDSPTFNELATFVDLSNIKVGGLEERYCAEFSATVKIQTLDGILWDVSVTKHPDGLLGIAAKI